MRLAEAEAWLEGLINLERSPAELRRARLSLAPVEALLARVGEPQRGLRVVHVAGSKGKGSTALLGEALLRAVGLSTGTFTSPHLERWTERFRIDGHEVPGDALAAAVTRLRPHVDALRQGADPPSFFDVTTAAAFLLFAEAGVDVALVEVGLGGRLDSTNVVAPAVCCITSIELEHTEKLGDTLAAIAGEKAGIAKAGVPLVVGALPAEAAEVVEARARALGCPLARLGGSSASSCSARRSRARASASSTARSSSCSRSLRPAGIRRRTRRWRSPACEGPAAWTTPRSEPPRRAPSPGSSCPGASRSSAKRPGSSSTARTPPPRRARSPRRCTASSAGAATSSSRCRPARIWRRSARRSCPRPIS
jgi:folylpolyglutamate synthase/dihydropteroate synthase